MPDTIIATDSPWLEMQDAVRSLQKTKVPLAVFVALMWVVTAILLAQSRPIDMGVFFLAILGGFVAVVLHDVHQFCLGTMERVRQLGERA